MPQAYESEIWGGGERPAMYALASPQVIRTHTEVADEEALS